MAEAARVLLVPNIPTTLTTVLTANTTWAGKCQLVAIRVINKTASAAWVSMVVNRGGTVTAVLPTQYPIDARSQYPETTHLVLEIGDSIQAQAQTANALDLILSGYEGVA